MVTITYTPGSSCISTTRRHFNNQNRNPYPHDRGNAHTHERIYLCCCNPTQQHPTSQTGTRMSRTYATAPTPTSINSPGRSGGGNDKEESTSSSRTSTSAPSQTEDPPKSAQEDSKEEENNDKENESTKNTSLSPGAAAGITAGVVLSLALLCAAGFYFWRTRKGGIRGAVVTADGPSELPGDDERGFVKEMEGDGPGGNSGGGGGDGRGNGASGFGPLPSGGGGNGDRGSGGGGREVRACDAVGAAIGMMGIKDEKEAARNGKTWEKESSGGGGGTVYVILPAIATGAVPGELGFKVPITSPPAAVSYPPHQSQKEAHGHEQPTREYYMSPASLVHLGTASGFVGGARDNPSSAQPISQPPTAVPPASYPAMAVSPITPGGSEGQAQTPSSAAAPNSLHFQYPLANLPPYQQQQQQVQSLRASRPI
ncbi:hypothetical protein VTJ04DRAFT_6905 [Mycothermus thermophilus]|uniref:uncharacterized protein n=1 Tax=Humicola insolens TaxID=85995 RepID=UPI0037438147